MSEPLAAPEPSPPAAPTRSGVAPLLAAAYLVAVAVGAFFIAEPVTLAALVVAQLVLGKVAGAPARQLYKPFRKLALFALLVIASYALLGGEDGELGRTITLAPWPWPISLTGALFGVTMALRVFAVVTASAALRFSGAPGDLVRGMQRLGLPRSVAELIDFALALLEAEPGAGGGHGSGQGGGHGHGGGHGQGKQKDERFSVRRVLRGDLAFLVDWASRLLGDAARAGQARGASRDLVVLGGLLVLMLSVKAVKVLPGLPFAPGYKGVILLPVYMIAVRLTSRRFAGTVLGAAFGMLAFLFGDGRYGAFEILKHIAPGLVADLFAGVLRGKERSLFTYASLGMLLAVGRWATVAAVVLLVDTPAMVVAVVAPVGLVHLVFGALSGLITRVFVRGAARLEAVLSPENRPSAAPDDRGRSADRVPGSGGGRGLGGGGGRGLGGGGGRGSGGGGGRRSHNNQGTS